MNKMIRFWFCGIALFLFSISGVSQSTPHMKFGKPLMEELKMEHYAKDTAASAVVLVDHGETRIAWNQHQGFQLIFERYTRIKVFGKDGYNWADVAIALYESDGSRESVGTIKGNTYNLEKGKVVKSKLEKSSIFEEQTSEHWSRKKFTMPDVKEGSVIEYTYTINSDFLFQFRNWSFQRSIPVAWSEYKARIPEYFNYKQLSQGYVPISIKEHDTSPGSFSYTTSNRPGGNVAKGLHHGTGNSTSLIEFKFNNYRWAVEHVPAFREERFITSVEDHLSKIRFELSSVKYPNQPVQQIMDSWETLDKKLMESDYFGDAIKKDGFIKDQVASITANSGSDLEIVQNVYSYVQENMKWNGIRDFYVESTLKKAYDDREGNSADINLLMVSMLRKAGLEANPVVLSTRDHGQILNVYPVLSQFNYVIAEVTVEGKQYLLDATDKFCPLNTLPYRCLNNTGRKVSNKSAWVDLTTTSKLNDISRIVLNLSADGTLEGTVVESKKGFTAANLRNQIQKDGEDKFVDGKFEDLLGWDLGDYKFENLTEKDKALVSSYEVTLSETAESVGELIYLNPIISDGLKENPFKIENRQYPVDLGAPYKQIYMATINLPEGYAVDELPKTTAFKLPDASAVFRYNVQQVGNSITLTSQIDMKKSVYNSEEYGSLKEFFNSIVDKNSQQIVLKKI